GLRPTRRYVPERRAWATPYRERARAAASGATATEAPPASDTITQALKCLATLRPDGSVEAERYLALLSQAERIRITLLALFRAGVRLKREGGAESEVEILGRADAIAAQLLASIGASLDAGVQGDEHLDCIR